MNPVEIPLLNALLILFNKLRSYGFPLGVEDYMLAIQALQGGFGMGDRQTLERLCCTLWTKSEQEARLLNRLFDEVLAQPQTHINQSSTTEPVKPAGEILNQPQLENQITEPPKPVVETSPPADIVPEIEPEQVIQAVRSNQPSSFETSYYPTDLSDEYLPVTSREMKQGWRFLRRRVREGTLKELDIAGTVEKNCRYGILPEPVMMPRYINQVKLVLLVDQGGSMVPFHHLSRQLIDKAKRGGNIKQTSVYYFQNYPEKYLYSDPTRLEAQRIRNFLESVDKKTSVLIVSDAGAARGNYNPERVEYTQKFVEQLHQSVNYYAWLNPMPNDSWQYTTADKIARFVPMFEMSREGLSAAINTLRGRYVYWEHPYQWM
ncbi:hypothetical protein A0J48_019515 [Sphaerospermopsis aphanizomenoides BCCUSP55]|uniref:hypothetical protein n=1 Tax=Sphaerospermopsis aphanizomenoides TaxID=459663 RepID=UPI001908E88C|nr:hypothetical protein [Sphaerospermopsis aphanizomenoides]MBK1989695.1 hypothetical protein [Sphaerospermopsis aphanizomenoides BCCUSP55]